MTSYGHDDPLSILKKGMILFYFYSFKAGVLYGFEIISLSPPNLAESFLLEIHIQFGFSSDK